MKPTARPISTSRCPIIAEASLINLLQSRPIVAAGRDVCDEQPSPPLHPFCTLDNILANNPTGRCCRKPLPGLL